MTMSYRLRVAWKYIREYAGAVIAAGLIDAGIHQVISIPKYVIGEGVIWCINFIIRTGFRDSLMRPTYGPLPWHYAATVIASGLIPVVLGILVGLWVKSRKGVTLSP